MQHWQQHQEEWNWSFWPSMEQGNCVLLCIRQKRYCLSLQHQLYRSIRHLGDTFICLSGTVKLRNEGKNESACDYLFLQQGKPGSKQWKWEYGADVFWLRKGYMELACFVFFFVRRTHPQNISYHQVSGKIFLGTFVKPMGAHCWCSPSWDQSKATWSKSAVLLKQCQAA